MKFTNMRLLMLRDYREILKTLPVLLHVLNISLRMDLLSGAAMRETPKYQTLPALSITTYKVSKEVLLRGWGV
jgi:hypothetical protein